jgi:hypothetical protein
MQMAHDHEEEVELISEAITSGEMATRAVKYVAAGGGMTYHECENPDHRDMIDFFAMKVEMLDGRDIEMYFDENQARFLAQRLMIYGAGAEGRRRQGEGT